MGMSGKILSGKTYSMCMVWVADSDCDMINAKTHNEIAVVYPVRIADNQLITSF